MKFSHLILGSIIALASFLVNHAEANSSHPNLPPPMASIRGTHVFAITELDTWEKGLVDRIIMRSEFGGRDQNERLKVIASVTDGRVTYRAEDSRVRALSNAMLNYITATRICDLQLFGECVVYDRQSRDGDARIFVVGTLLNSNGNVDILQSAFNPRVGAGSSASLYSLARRLDREVDTRSALFTRATRSY